LALAALVEPRVRVRLAVQRRLRLLVQPQAVAEPDPMQLLLPGAHRAQARAVTVATGREQYPAAAVAEPLAATAAMAVKVVRLMLRVLQGRGAAAVVATVVILQAKARVLAAVLASS
tara:strand:+ start:502 stop:852 length:351 start_codon:yes stop_codon:yes gene_type:complete